jgi:hypothetical protein
VTRRLADIYSLDNKFKVSRACQQHWIIEYLVGVPGVNVDLLILFQPSVHLVEGYFDEIPKVSIVANGNGRFGNALSYDDVIRGGHITLLWVPQKSFRHVGRVKVI